MSRLWWGKGYGRCGSGVFGVGVGQPSMDISKRYYITIVISDCEELILSTEKRRTELKKIYTEFCFRTLKD